MIVRFTPMALSDLKEIKAYIAYELSNESAAIGIIAKLYKDIMLLESLPNIGLDLEDKIDVRTNIKYLICGKYIVFYELLDNCVSVKRVFDSRTDYLRFVFMDYKKIENHE